MCVSLWCEAKLLTLAGAADCDRKSSTEELQSHRHVSTSTKEPVSISQQLSMKVDLRRLPFKNDALPSAIRDRHDSSCSVEKVWED